MEKCSCAWTKFNGDGEPWCCECGKIDLVRGTLESVPFGYVEKLEARIAELTAELEAKRPAASPIPKIIIQPTAPMTLPDSCASVTERRLREQLAKAKEVEAVVIELLKHVGVPEHSFTCPVRRGGAADDDCNCGAMKVLPKFIAARHALGLDV